MRIYDECGFGVFEDLNGKLATNRREVFEENLQRIACFQVLEQNPHRHSRPDEYGCAAEDFGVGDDAR
jgi:hypothetical protein